jgi:hypothetical protein
LPQKLAFPHQMFLPDELRKIARAHPRGKRLSSLYAISSSTFYKRHLPHFYYVRF